ncbi:MAG: DEAD/DEAH box helicase family protein [Proteobacteria bacterium]|nr:DEAD/DEAH box helicase family protein [Pseudomonadota bacterium]
MDSRNFEMLRVRWPELASLGGFAEQYAHSDPNSALIKLRSFAEQMVEAIYHIHAFSKPYQANLNDLLNQDSFKQVAPQVVLDKLHAIRIKGNKAAHGGKETANVSLAILREAYDLGRWFYLTFAGGNLADCPPYQQPAEDTKAQIKREKKAALQKLVEQEAQMQALLNELEAARAKAETAQKTAAELEAIAARGKQSASELKFDEETTRFRLIDSMLADAGWNVGANKKDTEEVKQELEVLNQPTDSGIGYADYVLYDDNGKPLAVIEAKKTAIDATQGRNQARIYADGLGKMTGQRPVIFYTNGFDVYIWDDAQGYPDRKVYGFYSKESLKYLVNFQRNEKKPLNTVPIKPEITDRLYQHEAIKRVREKFTDNHRKALIIQATGTGKTRVAIALTDVLARANWVKRVLFLCDRKELRKQAKNAFNMHMQDAPLTIVSKSTAKDRHHRIYLATYPAMMKIFQTFDVGFFDMIIADESHRSIYNRYRDLFLYFDCLQVGLTATPVHFINRNTFRLFGCEDKDPTFNYDLEQAVEAGYLVPYEVFTHTTNFLRKGIKYADLTDHQKQQLEEDGEDPEQFDYEDREVDKVIFNKETNRAILRNLMENGIREQTGQYPGKSIIFARNHKHAILLKALFDEMYPQYGGRFCQVIDNYDPRAEQLIDDLKNAGGADEITIAISVDMLDTGIDIPELVNLTFAKPIRSQVKFDQMIGRGTRLCPNLFGAGRDKKVFWIFDHWGNFEYFSKKVKEAEPTVSKSLMQQLFEARATLAETALQQSEPGIFDAAWPLIQQLVKALPDETIAVRDRRQVKHQLSETETLRQFSATTVSGLKNDIAPLMQWVNIRGSVDAYALDLLVTQLQGAHLQGSATFVDLKDKLLDGVSRLRMTLNPVRDRAETIKQVKSVEFWNGVSFDELEKVRAELRAIWQYRLKPIGPGLDPKVIDITDGGEEFTHRPTNLRSVDMKAYHIRVEEVLSQFFETNETLLKIKQGKPVSEQDLNALTSMVLIQNPDIDLNILKEFYGKQAVSLDFILRSIIGMDPDAVRQRFAEFVHKHPEFDAKQTRFLSLLQNHIAKYGSIEIERLYEPPFTTVDSNGLDGVFAGDAEINELISIVSSFGHENQAPNA